MARRTWIWLAIYSALTLVPGIVVLAIAEAARPEGEPFTFSDAGRWPHAVGALLIGVWMIGSIVTVRRDSWVVVALLIGWTALTAPLGIVLLALESGDFPLDYSPYGEILVSAWLAGSAVILGIAAARRAPRQHDYQERCPQCGRAVSAGAPACLNCGYNLVAGR